ncbi:MAG: HNH endonuclease [Elusimicrobia bacterium ADurb.Bin231]|nr:MAG: HNH endonuclease [Elusimicrobia bacterium ADurb.Bin231]
MDVLVLNKKFYAIHITTWQKAISLLFADHARVVDENYKTYDFNNWMDISRQMERSPSGFVHTPTLKIAIPDVIVLLFYGYLPPMDVKFTRRNIYEHYKYKCCYCGKKKSVSDLNLEHIIPVSRGGATNWLNVVTACISCNLKKGCKTPEEADMKLLVQPSKPLWKGPASLCYRPGVKFKASWQKFIDNMYWNSELE